MALKEEPIIPAGEFSGGSGDFLYVVGPVLIGSSLGPFISKDPRRSSADISGALLKLARMVGSRFENYSCFQCYNRVTVETKIARRRLHSREISLALAIAADVVPRKSKLRIFIGRDAIDKKAFLEHTRVSREVMLAVAGEADFWLIDLKRPWMKRRVPAPHTICYSSSSALQVLARGFAKEPRYEAIHRFEFRMNDLDNILGAIRRLSMAL